MKALFLILALGSLACAASTSDGAGAPTPRETRPSDGSVAGGAYTNAFFQFRLQIPDGWTVARPEENNALMDTGREMMTGDDEQRRAIARAAQARTTTLLTLSHHPLGTPGVANAILTSVSEFVPFAGIVEGSSYLETVRRQIAASPAAGSFEAQGEIERISLGGREFARLAFRANLNGQALRQVYVARREEQFILLFILTWQADGDEALLEDVLESLEYL